MALNRSQIEEIEALALHEETIGDLYTAFANRFPDDREFWAELSDEEYAHADWVRALAGRVEGGELTINEGRFSTKALENSMNYIKGWIKQAESEEITLLYALSIAKDIENALLDKNFFEVFEADSEDMANVLNALIEASGEHRDRVLEKLDEVSNRNV